MTANLPSSVRHLEHHILLPQRVAQKLAAGGRQPTAEETHKKVQHYLDDYEWEVQRDGG